MSISATRQELQKLKSKRKNVKRGHKLLKDKRDSLIQLFMQHVREAIELRKQVDLIYADLVNTYHLAHKTIPDTYLHILSQTPSGEVAVATKEQNLMGITTQQVQATLPEEVTSYAQSFTNDFLDSSVSGVHEALPQLMKLAEKESLVRKLAKEIEITRRRVNALEHTILPQIEDNIKYVSQKLAERDLQTTVTLMKVKSQITNNE